ITTDTTGTGTTGGGDGSGGTITGDGEEGNNGITLSNDEPGTTTSFTIAGPCEDKFRMKYDCQNEEVVFSIGETELLTLTGGDTPEVTIGDGVTFQGSEEPVTTKGITFIPQTSNPGTTETMWLHTGGPRLGTGQVITAP